MVFRCSGMCLCVHACVCVFVHVFIHIDIYIYICMYMCVCVCVCYREKFRSQTSDNMDTWKSRGAKNQRKGKKEDQRRERVGRKKMQVSRKKVEKSPNTVFFQWFVAPEGRKVGSLKQRVRSQLARWDEKSHAVVAWSTFPSQNAENISTSEHFWKMQSGKSARRCGAKHVSKSKCAKHQLRNNLRKCDVQKVHGVVARSAFGSENAKNTTWTLKLHFVWQAQGILRPAKSDLKKKKR